MSDPSKATAGPDPSKARPRLRCSARRSDGEPCQRWAVNGSTVCATHGGRAPQVRQAADRRRAEQEWARAFGALDATGGSSDPALVVLGEIAWAAAHVAWLREQVQALPPDELTFGVERSTVKKPAGTYAIAMAEITKAARPHALVVLYGQERDRLVKMCEVAHRMGIEERQLELTERHGAMLATVLRAVIGDAELGLTGDQQNVARQVAARHLRLVAGGAS